MVKSYLKTVVILVSLLLVLGCAPPREKPNDSSHNKNDAGSSELDDSIATLKRLGLDLKVDDLSAFGEENTDGVSKLLPDPDVLANLSAEEKSDLNDAILKMKEAVDALDDPNSLQAAYVHLYLGYSYILGAVADLNDPSNVNLYNDQFKIITKEFIAAQGKTSALTAPDGYYRYKFNDPNFTLAITGKLSPTDIDPDPEHAGIVNAEMQAVLNAVYLLTGKKFAPPVDVGWMITGPDATALDHTTNALAELIRAADLIGEVLPDSSPEELDKIKTDLESGITTEIEQTIADEWGFTIIN